MNNSGKLFLQWNDFQTTVCSAFRALHDDKNLTDVTLVSEDGQQVESHKIVLASSSPLLMDLLNRQKHPHPLIYMRGTGSEDLVSMVEFLYTGEVYVREGNLETFLTLANELKLKGFGKADEPSKLQVGQSDFSKSETISHPSEMTMTVSPLPIPKNEIQMWQYGNQPTDEMPVNLKQLKDRAVALNMLNVDLDQLEEQVMSMMEKSENDAKQSQGKGNSYGKARICKVCGKEGVMRAIKKHIESNHITGVVHNCNICGKAAKTRESLTKHISKYHDE